jgi:putative endonuclease
MSGATNYHAGLAAEDIAERLYRAQGAEPLARRYRCRAGEVDLILRLAGVLVFVEVKARKTLEDASVSISARQWARIGQTALSFLQEQTLPLDTPMRFDVVLVDRAGGAEIIEDAMPR